MLVTETLCPRHIRTPAWHSVIVRLAPSTSTQTVLPSSWHSEASLHSHALLWAGKEGRWAHGHIEAMVSWGVTSMWWLAMEPTTPWHRTRKARQFAPLSIGRFGNWCQACCYYLEHVGQFSQGKSCPAPS